MFVEKEIVEPVKIKKTRKKRGPMEPEAKAKLLERLAAGRLKKKLAKEALAKTTTAPAPIPAPIPHTAPIPIVKRPLTPPPPQVDNELLEMRKELEILKAKNKKQERSILKQAMIAEKEKMKQMAKPKIEIKIEKPKMEIIPEERTAITVEEIAQPKKKRYSTYQKSIWTKFE